MERDSGIPYRLRGFGQSESKKKDSDGRMLLENCIV